MTASSPSTQVLLDNALRSRRTLVCLGPGGVGKTTTSASLALRAASIGRRTLVLTVDPAHRLANSLGLDRFEHDEQEITRERFEQAGVPYGAPLHAMMLDTKRVFDGIVERYAPTPEARDRILSSPFYKEASTRLAGSQEYMAMEKLYSLLQERRYDLVVLDTPPTVHALDFLEAPGRLEEFMTLGDESVAARGGRVLGRLGLGFLHANTAILKGAGKFLGADVFTDILSFIGDFQTMYAGFRERAASVKRFMRSDDIAFLVITGPERGSVDEGLYLRDRLLEDGMPFAEFVVNRVRPEVQTPDPEALAAEPPDVQTRLVAAAEQLGALAGRDARELARLDKLLGRPALRVPESADDICDLADLHRYSDSIVGG